MPITASSAVQKLRGVVAISAQPSVALGALASGLTNVDLSVPELRPGDKVVTAQIASSVDPNIAAIGGTILAAAATDGSGGQVRVQLENRNAGAQSLATDPPEILILVARAGGGGS